MLRCPACNAGLPVDGVATIVTCSYCSARVEIDGRGRAQKPAPMGHGAAPHRSAFAWQWVMVPLVFAISIGMGAFQWWRAQSLISTPPPTVATPKPTPTPIPTRPPVTTIRDVAVTPTVATPPPIAADPPAPAPTTAPTTAPAKPRAVHPPKPAPTGPVISVEEARKQIEPKARACMANAKVKHLLAYMGNTTIGPVKVLPDSRTQVDGKKVALAKTPLGRCLNAAGAKVSTSAFRSNYVRLDVRL
jgi:hypothetical protein